MKRMMRVVFAGLVGALLVLPGTLPSHAQRALHPTQQEKKENYAGGPFTATVLMGRDKGFKLTGELRLFRRGTSNQFVGRLKLRSGRKIPVSAQLTGEAVSLFMHMGPGRNIYGTGVVGYDPHLKKHVMGGTFAGPREGDFGTWAMVKSS